MSLVINFGNRDWTPFKGYNPRVDPFRMKQYISKIRKPQWRVLLKKEEPKKENKVFVREVLFPLKTLLGQDGQQHNFSAMAKMIPRATDWQNEVTIATFLSKQVEEKKTNRFPLVYQVLEDKLCGCEESIIMISERATSDLDQFARFIFPTLNLSIQEKLDLWLDIFAQIQEAICFLQSARIVHNDLYAKNVLVNVVVDEKKKTIICQIKVHDFGESRALNQDYTDDFMIDLKGIMNSIASLPNIPKGITRAIKKLVKSTKTLSSIDMSVRQT